jgi:hypothetical protein
MLWDWGSHDVSMCLDLMQCMPIEAAARVEESRTTPEGDGDVVSIHLEFPGGAAAHIRLSNLMEKKTRRFTAAFDSCALEYDDLNANKLVRRPPRDDMAHPVPVGTDLPLTVALREFCDAIRAGSRDHASLDLGVNVVKVLEQCASTSASR